MLSVNLAIKFGSNEIIIYRKGYGIIAKEPAYLAVIEKNNKVKVKASGKEAEKLFYSKSKDITVYRPIENSEIINKKMAIKLITEILQKTIKEKILYKISALVAVPCGLGSDELLSIKQVLHASGVDKVEFVQNAVCVLANSVQNTDKHMIVVDIGKYLTDISVLSSFDFYQGKMYYIGGEDMDKSITAFIQDNHELTVSDQTSEAIKNEIASLYERDMCKTQYVGINKVDRFTKQTITADEVRVAITSVYDSIVGLINNTIDELPKEIFAEINDMGIMVVGGGCCIAGLYEYLSSRINVPLKVVDNPSDCVILGAGKLLSQKEFLKIEL